MFKVLSILIGALCSLSISGQTDLDKKAIHQIVQDMADGWTAGDGAAFAHHFADEHDFYVWNGLYMPNLTKQGNTQNHQHIFNTMYKNTDHYAVVDKIRFIRPDVAVIMVMGALAKKGDPRPEYPQVLWSGTLAKNGGKWMIHSFHNADIEILETSESRATSFIPIETMYGSWNKQDVK